MPIDRETGFLRLRVGDFSLALLGLGLSSILGVERAREGMIGFVSVGEFREESMASILLSFFNTGL